MLTHAQLGIKEIHVGIVVLAGMGMSRLCPTFIINGNKNFVKRSLLDSKGS
jgi:hypothetical protein